MTSRNAPPRPRLGMICGQCFKLVAPYVGGFVCYYCGCEWTFKNGGVKPGSPAGFWLDEHGHPHTCPEEDE